MGTMLHATTQHFLHPGPWWPSGAWLQHAQEAKQALYIICIC